MATWKTTSATPWASAGENAQAWRCGTWNPGGLGAAPGVETALRRRFHLGIEVCDDVIESRNRLLNRGDLHQFPAADRAGAILQGDDQIPPLLLELNKWQTVVRQISHHGGSHPLDWTTMGYSGVALPLAYKSPANFNQLRPADGLRNDLPRHRLLSRAEQRLRHAIRAPIGPVQTVGRIHHRIQR